MMLRCLLALLLLCTTAEASIGRDNGQYENMDPAVRQWFRSQKNPKTGMLCCSEADGLYVEEDIREGKYWIRGGLFTEWTEVPEDVVIHDPNRNGAPVVWWYYSGPRLEIRCYAPGGGV